MSAKKVTVKVVEVAIRKGREGNPFAGIKPSDLKDATQFVSIKEAVSISGFASHPLYIRQLLKAGKLEGLKLKLHGHEKWYVSVASIEYYNANKNTRTGMRRFLLRTSADNETAVRDALTALGIEYTLEFNYVKGKSKPKTGKAPAEDAVIDSIEF